MAARCRLFIRATSLGGAHSLIEHRASVEGPQSRTPQNLLRVSVGLEHADDLMEDLNQALGLKGSGAARHFPGMKALCLLLFLAAADHDEAIRKVIETFNHMGERASVLARNAQIPDFSRCWQQERSQMYFATEGHPLCHAMTSRWWTPTAIAMAAWRARRPRRRSSS